MAAERTRERDRQDAGQIKGLIIIDDKSTRADWAAIETEYITGEIGTYKLADKYGIPRPSLRYHYDKEKWGQKRKEYRQKLVEKSSQKAADAAASNAAKLEKARGILLDLTLGVLEKYPRNAGNKLRTFGTDSKGNDIMTEFELAALASVLEKLGKTSVVEAADDPLMKMLARWDDASAGQ